MIPKTRNKFSAMALDQSHEQNDAMVKGSGRSISMTGSPGALRHRMVAGPKIAKIIIGFEKQAIKNQDGVAGPEIAKIITKFEKQAIKDQDGADDTGHNHHDQQPGV